LLNVALFEQEPEIGPRFLKLIQVKKISIC